MATRPSLIQVIVLCVACAFLGGAAVYAWQARDTAAKPNAADVGFLDDMSAHHAQAVEMSLSYLADGTDPFLRHVAREIIFTQVREQGFMTSQLDAWGEVGNDTAMEWMGMSVPEEQQPGMATNAQMAELERVSGSRLDDLFTRLMIEHHAGGIHMSEAAADLAATAYVRDLSSSIATAQGSEIAELNRARTEFGLPPVTPKTSM